MSSLLEQAMVDAEALKNAALKTAKQEVLQKYSEDVKTAVDTLLEQEGGGLDLGLDFGAEAPAEDAGAIEGEALEGEGLEGEVIEEEGEELELKSYDALPYKHRKTEKEGNDFSINLQQLEEQIDQIYGEVIGKEEKSYILASPEQEIELVFEEDKKSIKKKLEVDAEADVELEIGIEGEEEKSEEEIDEEIDLADDILEVLRVDYKTVPTGHVGAFTGQELEYALEMEKIKEKYSDLSDKNKKQKIYMEQAVICLDKMEEKNEKLIKTIKEHKGVITQLKQKLNETNLNNAKLFYTNRVLASPSLNERQKQRLVEALSRVDSPKEARVIFETLQSAVGTSKERSPKSLSEAVEKRSLLTMSPHRRKETTNVEEAISDRWQKLAGIK